MDQWHRDIGNASLTDSNAVEQCLRRDSHDMLYLSTKLINLTPFFLKTELIFFPTVFCNFLLDNFLYSVIDSNIFCLNCL